jgi:hypothetical protein
MDQSTKPEICGKMSPEHDPEKWVPVFPSRQTRSVCAEIMLNKRIERDDDSTKNHPAPGSSEPAESVTGTHCTDFASNCTPFPALFRAQMPMGDRQRRVPI